MDFTKIKVEGAERVQKAKPVTAVHVKMHQFKIGGVPLEVDIMPTTGEQFQTQVRAWRKRHQATLAVTDRPNVPDDILAKMGEDEDNARVELVARTCVGWNLKDGDEPIECTWPNVLALFQTFPEIGLHYTQEMSRVTDEVGNLKKS